mgnify:CR=1 FL=1
MGFQTLPSSDGKGDRPWWLVALVVIGLVIAAVIALNALYSQVFTVIAQGLLTTVFVTLVGFVLATALGLGIALLGMSDHVALRQTARFYIEVIRGVPILVLLFYIAFVGAPAIVGLYNLVISPLTAMGLSEPMLVLPRLSSSEPCQPTGIVLAALPSGATTVRWVSTRHNANSLSAAMTRGLKLSVGRWRTTGGSFVSRIRIGWAVRAFPPTSTSA